MRAGPQPMFGDEYIRLVWLPSGVMTVGVVRFDARQVLLAPPCEVSTELPGTRGVAGIMPTTYDRYPL